MSTNNLNANKFDIEKIIEKMEDVDHDFRFMAASDLADEMQKENFKLNSNIERRVVDGVIKLLGDKSGDVKGMIVKCLGPLVQKVNEENVSRIIGALLDHICEHESKKSKMREISTLGLKAIIKSVDEKHGASVSEQLVSELIKGVKIQDAPQVTSECLDILNDLLKRFGASLSEKNFKIIVEALIPELKGKHQLAKKRTIHCLASISPFINEELFVKIAEELLQGLNVESNKRTYIQAVGILARSVGKRIGVYVDKFSPLLIEAVKSEEDDEDDIKDYALQTFESFLVSCRENVNEKLFGVIFDLVSDKIKYDPNYNEEEDDEDEKNDSGSENEEDEEDEELDESSQGVDDESWKVRKASAKVFSASMSTSGPKDKLELATKILPILAKRISERAETVRLEIYSTFVELLKHLQSILKSNEGKVKELLSNSISGIVKQLNKQLSSKYPKTKIAALQLFKEFLNTSPYILQDHITDIIKTVIPSIGENKNLPLKIEAISFVKLLFTHNKPSSLVSHVEKLSTPIFSSVKSTNVQAATEALKVCVEFLKIIDVEKPSFDVNKFVNTLRSSVSPQFRANDIDFHIKESAISVVSLLISKFSKVISEENLKEDLKLLVFRLKNEITRPASLSSFEMIGSSKINEQLVSFVLKEVVEELISCIRKASRHLKTGALSTLYILVHNYGTLKEISSLYNTIIEEVSGQLESSSNDLFIYQLSFRLITQILISSPSCVLFVKEKLYQQVLVLVKTSIFEGKALEALLAFFGQLVIISEKEFGFDHLLDSLLKNNESKKNKNFSLIAKCVASVCVNSGKEKCITSINTFLNNIKEVLKEQAKLSQQKEEKSNSENKEVEEQVTINPEVLISIYAIGEIGKKIDLSEITSLQEILFNCFDTHVEELRSAASLSLGSTCTGNLDKFIPFILNNIKENNPKRQYLLLHSLKQVVVGKSTSDGINELNKHFDHIIEILFDQSSNEEDHSIVAECLGKLATLDPKKMIPKLAEAVNNEKKRVCILASLRYLKFSHHEENEKDSQELHHKDSELIEQLSPNLDLFISLLNDKSALVRGSILQSLNYLASSIPHLVSKYLLKYMNVFYEQTKIKEELIRFVDLGPFKHEVDDGLDLRKYAFQCMYTLLEYCPELVSVESYIQHIITGLSDQNEIKLQCHLLIVKLANISGASLLKSLNLIVDPLRSEIAKKIDSSVTQAKNGALELKRSALSAVASITKKIPDWQTSTKFAELVNGIMLTPSVKDIYLEILKEIEN